jgi:hypothetical protein
VNRKRRFGSQSLAHSSRTISPVVSALFLQSLQLRNTASNTFTMRFIQSFYIVVAFVVLQLATAMPTKVRVSKSEVKAKRDGDVVPSFRLRQTSYQEIQARQEMRKNPLYKRQMPSAVFVPRSVSYPSCSVVQGNFPLARYPGTDIITPVSKAIPGPISSYSYFFLVQPGAGQFISATRESECLELCEMYGSGVEMGGICVGYVFAPSTEKCYLKVSFPKGKSNTYRLTYTLPSDNLDSDFIHLHF